jgi:hypothetical protein
MLKNISWTNYEIFILITLVVYYITIGCLYYRDKIKQVLSGQSNLFLRLSNSKRANGNHNSSLTVTPVAKDDLQRVIREYTHQIKDVLKQAADENIIKQEIIYSLQQLAGRYSIIKNSPFRSFITNYILIECENYCSIHLDEDELNRIWEN